MFVCFFVLSCPPWSREYLQLQFHRAPISSRAAFPLLLVFSGVVLFLWQRRGRACLLCAQRRWIIQIMLNNNGLNIQCPFGMRGLFPHRHTCYDTHKNIFISTHNEVKLPNLTIQWLKHSRESHYAFSLSYTIGLGFALRTRRVYKQETERSSQHMAHI